MRKNRESGAVTVEASIALVVFVFAITTILTAIDICLVQARISCAIDATAKEISQYSYLYGLTGLNVKKKELADKAQNAKNDIDQVRDVAGDAVAGISDIIGSVQNTASSVSSGDLSEIKSQVSEITGKGKKLKDNADRLKPLMDKISKDPKAFIFSIAQLAGSELLDVATSKLIAEPISRAMVQKHLRAYEGQSTEDYLRALRIVPDATGSYLGGLDFSDSTLFLYGSDEICIIVKYKIKIITLLPIDHEYYFRQIAITKGWLGGDEIDSKDPETALNDSIWLLDVKTRSGIIDSQVGSELKGKGYYQTTDGSRLYYYNPETNSMYTIMTSNLMYSEENPTKKIEDITESEIENMLYDAVYNQATEWDGKKHVTYSTPDDSKVEHEIPADPPLNKNVMLVIPEDTGLKQKIQDYIDAHPEKTYGFNFEIVPSYGKGAISYEVDPNAKQQEQETPPDQ